MEETYLERIKKLKSERKITNDKLSEMTGIPLGTLSKLLAGINDSPKLTNIIAISQALGCSLDWMITGVPENTNNYTLTPEEIDLVEQYRLLDAYGRGLTLTVVEKEWDRVAQQKATETLVLHDTAKSRTPRAKRPTSAALPSELSASGAVPFDEAGTDPASLDGYVASATSGASPDSGSRILPFDRRSDDLPAGLRRRRIPMYDLPVSAGVGEFLSESSRSHTDITIPDSPRTVEADYALRISGNSMEPRYRSGDVLLVQTAESVEEGELGIFVLDGSGYFKKYGGDRLISINPQYAPILLKDFSSVTCCGRVVGKLKRK
jgi:transcriptional regulator with XRE-family HTH domain